MLKESSVNLPCILAFHIEFYGLELVCLKFGYGAEILNLVALKVQIDVVSFLCVVGFYDFVHYFRQILVL